MTYFGRGVLLAYHLPVFELRSQRNSNPRNAGTRVFLISGPRPDVHSSLRPAPLLTPPCEALSVGFARQDFPSRRHPSYVASIFCHFSGLEGGIERVDGVRGEHTGVAFATV
jgi:hypothetical protein